MKVVGGLKLLSLCAIRDKRDKNVVVATRAETVKYKWIMENDLLKWKQRKGYKAEWKSKVKNGVRTELSGRDFFHRGFGTIFSCY